MKEAKQEVMVSFLCPTALRFLSGPTISWEENIRNQKKEEERG
jgi:hypothetical protein